MASGWWDDNGAISGCVAAYRAIGAASLAASYSNLQSPGTFDASPGVAPTFSAATGWTFNGTTQYLTTPVVPANNQTWSALARISGGGAQAGSGAAIFGAYNGSPTRRWYYIPHYVNNNAYVANGGQSARSPGIDSGVVGFRGAQPVRNGSDDGAALAAGGAGVFESIYIGAAHDAAGFAALFWAGNVQAIAIYSTTLTAGQVATLTAAMNALAASSSHPSILHAAQRAAFA